MNLARLTQLYQCGLYTANQIGARNIIFFGLLGTAVAAEYSNINIVISQIHLISHITDFTYSNEYSQPRQYTSIPIDPFDNNKEIMQIY